MKNHSLSVIFALVLCALCVPADAQSPAEAAMARSAKAAEDRAAAEKAAAEKAAADKAVADKTGAAAAAPPALVYKEGVIKVGTEMKQTLGKLVDVDKGDNGCYLTLTTDKNVEFIEVGKFEICTQKAAIKGKRVALAFSLETIQAASCYGDPKCKKTETLPLVIGVKVVD